MPKKVTKKVYKKSNVNKKKCWFLVLVFTLKSLGKYEQCTNAYVFLTVSMDFKCFKRCTGDSWFCIGWNKILFKLKNISKRVLEDLKILKISWNFTVFFHEKTATVYKLQLSKADMAHRGLEQPKKFTNLWVKKDECLENQKCYLDPK